LFAEATQVISLSFHFCWIISIIVISFWQSMQLKQEIVQEQITRVLLERLIVNRPHPWGLLITFIELIKVCHLDYSKQMCTCEYENEKLFLSVEPTLQLLD
jgi:CCR4-NOT transcription complex subunit 1